MFNDEHARVNYVSDTSHNSEKNQLDLSHTQVIPGQNYSSQPGPSNLQKIQYRPSSLHQNQRHLFDPPVMASQDCGLHLNFHQTRSNVLRGQSTSNRSYQFQPVPTNLHHLQEVLNHQLVKISHLPTALPAACENGNFEMLTSHCQLNKASSPLTLNRYSEFSSHFEESNRPPTALSTISEMSRPETDVSSSSRDCVASPDSLDGSLIPEVVYEYLNDQSEKRHREESSKESTGKKVEFSHRRRKAKKVIPDEIREQMNMRERKRMKALKEAFEELKSKIPVSSSEERLTHMRVVKLATLYIEFLLHAVTSKELVNYIGDSQCIDSDAMRQKLRDAFNFWRLARNINF